MLLSIIESTMLLAQSASDPWADQFFGLDEDKRFVVLLVAISCVTGIILGGAGIVTSLVNSIHRRNAEAAMKQDMLDRGMSADEIAKVVESSPSEDAVSIAMADCMK